MKIKKNIIIKEEIKVHWISKIEKNNKTLAMCVCIGYKDNG